MANKYTRKSKQTLLKKPDEFVSFWTRIILAIRPYTRPISIGLGAFVVIVLTVWLVDHFVVVAQEDATEQLGRAMRIYEAELDTGEAKADDAAKDDVKAEGDVPRFKTEKERAEATLAELDQLMKKHGSTRAAHRGLLFQGGVFFALGRYDEAEVAYKKFLDKAEADNSLRFLAREGVALCEEARGRLDQALVLYQEMGRGGGDFYRDRAMYAEARLYEKKGDGKKAAEVYKEILAKTPQTLLRDDISGRLALLGATP